MINKAGHSINAGTRGWFDAVDRQPKPSSLNPKVHFSPIIEKRPVSPIDALRAVSRIWLTLLYKSESSGSIEW
jgi:hypothetical protein